MKLSDQEQVILKAIHTYGAGWGIATTEHVIKAVGYPKDTTKKVLAGLYNKGVVVLHRYDYARALKPEQRKYLVRMQDGAGNWHYFNAVSVMKKNPKGKHLPGLPAKAQREYEHVLKTELAMGRTTKRAKSIAAGKVKKDYGAKRNPVKLGTFPISALVGLRDELRRTLDKTKGATARHVQSRLNAVEKELLKRRSPSRKKNKTIIKAKRVVIKKANPRKRIKVRNKYVDLVIKGQATKTTEGWKVGRKVYPWGKGTIQVKPHVYLDKSTGFYYVKKERNPTRKGMRKGYREAKRISKILRGRPGKSFTHYSPSELGQRKAARHEKRHERKSKRNVSEGFYDASGVFHPIRSSADYSPAAAGESGRAPKKTRSRKKIAAKRKASSTARTKSRVRTRKATTRRLAGRALKKSTGLLKKGKRRNPAPMTLAIVNRTSPRAKANRKAFAGEYRKDTPLYFPEGTPGGLSKLGKLLEIKTKKVIVKPHTQTWLCRDAQGRFHLGTTSKGAVIWNGPKQDFGQVVRVDYEDVKKHLGYHKPQGFYHFMGEEDGKRPSLYADGKGGLKFKGGNYRITPEGVVN